MSTTETSDIVTSLHVKMIVTSLCIDVIHAMSQETVDGLILRANRLLTKLPELFFVAKTAIQEYPGCHHLNLAYTGNDKLGELVKAVLGEARDERHMLPA